MATIKKMPISLFVEQLKAAQKRKDGYIMASRGQNPKQWAKNSWWFTQYNGNAKQKEKALYWREHAERVWDCQGMSEGLYNDYAGTNIDVRARNNYADWCSPKGSGMIPSDKRIPGAAVFWSDSKASDIHHVGYLIEPVDINDPKGDWYIIEARGVMYGVVKTKLFSRKPNFWGYMTKYFDYDANEVVVDIGEPAPPVNEITGDYVDVTKGNYNVRTKPSTSTGTVIGVAKKGTKVAYLGETKDKWYKVKFEGKTGWIHSNCGKIVTATGMIEESKTEKNYLVVKKGSWNVRSGPDINAKRLNTVHEGDKLTYLGETENNWHHIEFGKLNGWVSDKAIQK